MLMSDERGQFQPSWWRGNLVLFGVAALALVVFVGTLAYVLGGSEPEAQPAGPRAVPRELKVELGDRGTVDLEAKTLTVTLRLSGLGEAAGGSTNVQVSLDGREAEVQLSQQGEEQEVRASARMEEKVENLVKSNGVGAVLLIKGVCEHAGQTTAFDVSATQLQVVSKTGKEWALAFANFPDPMLAPAPRTTPKPKPSPTVTPTPSPLMNTNIRPPMNTNMRPSMNANMWPSMNGNMRPSASPRPSPARPRREIFLPTRNSNRVPEP